MKARHPTRVKVVAAVMVQHRDGTVSWHNGKGSVLMPTVPKRAKIVHYALQVRK
jgi:hypothetical protein